MVYAMLSSDAISIIQKRGELKYKNLGELNSSAERLRFIFCK